MHNYVAERPTRTSDVHESQRFFICFPCGSFPTILVLEFLYTARKASLSAAVTQQTYPLVPFILTTQISVSNEPVGFRNLFPWRGREGGGGDGRRR
jgi:hypothetical protein